jgi:hypothetical protein
MDTRNTDFSNVNTNKRKAHVWISSLVNAIPGSAFYATSPSSSSLYNINIQPESMPGYSKYTVQVKLFQLNPLNTVAGVPGVAAYVDFQTADNKQWAHGCFIEIEGLPSEMNYVPDILTPTAGVATRANQRMGHIVAAFDSGYSSLGYVGDVRPDQPKIVVTRQILGNNQLRIEIIDQASFELVVGVAGVPLGAGIPTPPPITALPAWGMCLEIEGVDGFEDEPRHQFPKQPNPTNGQGTAFQSGFQDSYKKGTTGPRQVGL